MAITEPGCSHSAAQYYDKYGWTFKVTDISVSVNGMTATVNYKIKVDGSANNQASWTEGRTACWCRIFEGNAWDNAGCLVSNESYAKATPTLGACKTNTEVYSGSYSSLALNSAGEGWLRVVAVGAYGNTYTDKKSWNAGIDFTIKVVGGWSALSNPTIKFEDLKNNSCKCTVTAGTGTNNEKKSIEMKYQTRQNGPWTSYKSGDPVPSCPDLSLNADVSNIRFWAKITDSHGKSTEHYSPSSGWHDVNRYAGPTKPALRYNGKAQHTKSRLTIREPFYYEWFSSQPFNKKCSTLKYGIKLYLTRNDVETVLMTSLGSNNIPYDSWAVESNDTRRSGITYTFDASTDVHRLTIDPNIFIPYACNNDTPNSYWPLDKLKPGDTIRLSVFSWSTNGQGNRMYNGSSISNWTDALKEDGNSYNDAAYYMANSEAETFQNAAVVRVNTVDGWKEGIVWVKTADGWKEADSVYIKTADTNSISDWKESI